jgi:hypothetical protein
VWDIEFCFLINKKIALSFLFFGSKLVAESELVSHFNFEFDKLKQDLFCLIFIKALSQSV